jgi:hypothetical protein
VPPLVIQRPFLRALSLVPVVERPPGVGMHAVDDEMQVGMARVVMRDDQRLVLAPPHRMQEIVGRPAHLLPCGGLPRRPGEAHGLDGRAVLPAGRRKACTRLQMPGVLGSAPHLVDGRVWIAVGQVARRGESDALRGARARVVGVGLVMEVIGPCSAKGAAVAGDVRHHEAGCRR